MGCRADFALFFYEKHYLFCISSNFKGPNDGEENGKFELISFTSQIMIID